MEIWSSFSLSPLLKKEGIREKEKSNLYASSVKDWKLPTEIQQCAIPSYTPKKVNFTFWYIYKVYYLFQYYNSPFLVKILIWIDCGEWSRDMLTPKQGHYLPMNSFVLLFLEFPHGSSGALQTAAIKLGSNKVLSFFFLCQSRDVWSFIVALLPLITSSQRMRVKTHKNLRSKIVQKLHFCTINQSWYSYRAPPTSWTFRLGRTICGEAGCFKLLGL